VLGVGVPAVAVAIHMLSKAESAPNTGVLSSSDFRPFRLLEIHPVTHNTSLYRFSTNDEKQSLGLSIASCILTRATIDGKDVIRPYTPVSQEHETGHFDLMIKTYPKGVMSKHMASLKVGDSLDVKGPFSKIPVTTNFKKKIGLIAGGTGITPMLQVIEHILNDPKDTTEITLLYANVTEDDILLKDRINGLAKKHKRFKVQYVVDNPGRLSGFLKGRVSGAMISRHMPPPGPDNLVMVCGPPPMMDAICGDKLPDKTQGPVVGFLRDLKYDSGSVFKF